jgi:hypothetical protein
MVLVCYCSHAQSSESWKCSRQAKEVNEKYKVVENAKVCPRPTPTPTLTALPVIRTHPVPPSIESLSLPFEQELHASFCCKRSSVLRDALNSRPRSQAGASSAVSKATEINEKYKVTEKVSKGFISGLNKVF